MYDDATRLIQLAPNYRTGYELRGHAYLETGQQLEAVADFTKAIAIGPNAIFDYRMRGRAFYFLNLFDSAMADFDAALRIDPKDSETLSFINDLRRKQRGR
jgi:tetratricopeptide (TPR) repeat protein